MLSNMVGSLRNLSFLALALSAPMTAGSLQTALAADPLANELQAGNGVSGGQLKADERTGCPDGGGPCTIFGDKTSLLGGSARTYVQLQHDGKPRALGVEFTRSMLANLPYEPPFDGNNCFDINGDGELSFHMPMPECAGGYQAILFFPAKIVSHTGLPFKWFLLNWNPLGHGPIGVYDRPHFDFHFFIMPYVQRNFIRVGPCGFVVDCDDFRTAIKPMPPQFVPPTYRSFDAVEPRMGNHLVDVTSSEFTGEVFTRTFVYGSYDAKLTFLEPMITLEWLETRANECVPIKQPLAFEGAGYYPTTYCIRYRHGIYTVSLEGLKLRQGF